MRALARSKLRFRPSLFFVLLCTYLALLLVAGGSSRADVIGQAVVRAAGTALVVVALLLGRWHSRQGVGAVAVLLGMAILLALSQLIPLPPAMWQALPGRAVFAQAAVLAGEPQPWRPWAIVPAGAENAAASLIVPATVLVLMMGLTPVERRSLPGVVLALIAAATIAGLLQFSGAGFTNRLSGVNGEDVSGVFANRNHFALFLAFGCLLAPAWASSAVGHIAWRGAVALGLCVLFVMTVMATGSRAGVVLGALGFGIGLFQAKGAIGSALRRTPRWIPPLIVAALIAVVALAVLASVASDRAVSINRALAIDPSQDMRRRGLPIVVEMIRTYFPAGAGFGSFDPLFRLHEPDVLLKRTVFNHAHNDWLEVVLDGGLLGALLLAAGSAWWSWASLGAWRAGPGAETVVPRLGSAMLLLVMIASVFDYPARTPLVMAMVVIAAVWLASRPMPVASVTLPVGAEDV